MSKFTRSRENILDMHSQWVGESFIRTVVRHYGKKKRIMVDVMEYSPKYTSKQRGFAAAKEAARRVGCSTVDCCNVRDDEIVRVSQRLDSDEPVRTKIRSMSFAFDGIAQ